jgi:hypothetical protein
MDLEALWDKARKQTEIIRMQLRDLATFESTVVPYVFLAESSLNVGDSIRRRGQVVIERPSIVLPQFSPQFEGFDFDPRQGLTPEMVSTFLLVRGVQFPSLRYRHQVSSLDVVEASLAGAIRQQADQLQRAEDTRTGLVVGPEDAWMFSVLLLVGALVIRSAEGDVRRLLEEWRRRQREGSSG